MQLVKEHDLDVTIELVPSHRNLADVLTRVPARWMSSDDSCGSAGGSRDRTKKKKKEKKNIVNGSSEGHVNADGDEENSAAEVVAALNDEEEQTALDSVRTTHDRLDHPGVAQTLYFAR